MKPVRLACKRTLAALLVLAAAEVAAADIERARQIVSARCFLCHGMNGESSSEMFPRLATQNATYVAKQLRDFQTGRRKGTTMNDMVAGITEAEMAALGAFFATQRAEPHAPTDPELAAVGRFLYLKGNPYSGVASCASCHGATAHGSESLPRLAGQQSPYIEGQLKEFNKRERTNDNAVMHSIAMKLTELEIKALAEYLASVP